MKNETCLKPSSLMKIKMKYINNLITYFVYIYENFKCANKMYRFI